MAKTSYEVKVMTSHGRRQFQIDDSIFGCHSIADGNEMNLKHFVAAWLSYLSDSPMSLKPPRVFARFIATLKRDGIKETILRYSELAHHLSKAGHTMGSLSSIREWIDLRDTPVFMEYHDYLSTGSSSSFSYVYSFLSFGKKLPYSDDEFFTTAFRDWKDNEQKLGRLELDPADVSIMKCILQVHLPSFSMNDFDPKFGPGSVAEKGIRGRIVKLRNLTIDPLVRRFLLFGYLGFHGNLMRDPSRSFLYDLPESGKTPHDLWSRLHFVPKNLKVARSICMEPNSLMFIQQGIQTCVRGHIENSYFGRFIDIREQTRNQELARCGSEGLCIDTLDLSSASDLLAYDLVRRVFPASWVIALSVTRSRVVDTPDGFITIKKFAPMGSALCFPIQCIVFTAVVTYATLLWEYNRLATTMSFSEYAQLVGYCPSYNRKVQYSLNRCNPPSVYGDDICCDSKVTQNVKSILTRLGFVINDSKSYYDGEAFRESCGKFYLDGADVTPLYYRIKGVKSKLTPDYLASAISLLNKCFERGLRYLYRFLHSQVKKWALLPYVPAGSNEFGIFSNFQVNNHLKKRWNKDLQREEFRVANISYDWDMLSRSDELDCYQHMRWWADRGDSKTPSIAAWSHRDRGGAKLKRRWTPLYI